MKEIKEKIESIIKYHIDLHGKNIVDYAIVDDCVRKLSKYNVSKEKIKKIVISLIIK